MSGQRHHAHVRLSKEYPATGITRHELPIDEVERKIDSRRVRTAVLGVLDLQICRKRQRQIVIGIPFGQTTAL